eukprot:9479198-Pyramimonas_sp.AAC.1
MRAWQYAHSPHHLPTHCCPPPPPPQTVGRHVGGAAGRSMREHCNSRENLGCEGRQVARKRVLNPILEKRAGKLLVPRRVARHDLSRKIIKFFKRCNPILNEDVYE